MNYTELVDFLEHKMSMSHVYQPLLVRALVDSGGTATLRQIAHVFLSQDESQLLYYEMRIKDMPLKVLKRHGVIESDGQLVSLRASKLTLEQKAHIWDALRTETPVVGAKSEELGFGITACSMKNLFLIAFGFKFLRRQVDIVNCVPFRLKNDRWTSIIANHVPEAARLN
jgi:hypothetical protein